MLAKILSDGRVYYSPVFALSMKYPCKAVVFDSSFAELTVVNVCKKDRYNVLFMNFDADGFSINNSELKSYWDDKNIFRTVKRKRYTPKMLDEAKDILRGKSICEFTKIEKKSDLEALEFNSGSFHDGSVLGMNEESDTLEILLDTSWGAFIALRCKGVERNALELGQVFSHCDMRIDNGCVEFSFEPMSGAEEKTLIAKDVEFKPIFERRIDIKRFDYHLSDNTVTIKANSELIEIKPSVNGVLGFKQRSVLGYIDNDDTMQRCLIFGEDIVYRLWKYVANRKHPNKFADKLLAFQNECKENGFYFDQSPVYDDSEEYEYDYGELIYSHKYSAIHAWHLLSQIIRFALPILLINNVVWVIIKLINPEMEWTVYLIMGLGISLFVLLYCTLAFLIGLITEKLFGHHQAKCLEIYENRIKHNGYNTSFDVDYDNITAVEYEGRIVVHTTWRKFKLHKFKDDKAAYLLIKKQLDK